MSLHSMPSILLHLGVASSSAFLSSTSSSSTLLSSFTSLVLLFLLGRISPQSHPDPLADAPRRSPRGRRLPPDVDGCSSSASASARQTEVGWRSGFPEGRAGGARGKVKTDSRLLSSVYLVADDDYAQKREARRRRTEEGKGGGASFAAFLPLSTHTLREAAAVEEEEEGKTSSRAGEGEG